MSAIEILDASKTFGAVTAVDHLSLTVPEGSIYGFIGPNGSGKSTTMRMIAGIFRPDQGVVRVSGTPLGYLPEERGLYRKMAVRPLLEFHGELRSGRNVAAEVSDWLRRLDLADWADRPVETLSKGMTQKVQFIAAVVPRPQLVILDEPFSGLDPVSAESIRSAILELRSLGTAVVLSTHDMNVAGTLCDSICMIFRGRKVLDGTLASIQALYGSDTICIEAENGAASVLDLPGVEHVRDLGQLQELRVVRGADPQEIVRILLSRTRVTSFSIKKPSLHDIFVRIAGPEQASSEKAGSASV